MIILNHFNWFDCALRRRSGLAHHKRYNRQFLTKEQDKTGLVYFGARYYDPRIGRFITPDPLGMVDGPNLYVYCNNDPVNAIDPTGLDTYYINNDINEARPTWSPGSHSFVAITDVNPITGEEVVTETYSWVDTNGGMWEPTSKEQNKIGAQAALIAKQGAWKMGGEDLDPYVKAEFEKRKNEIGGFWPWTRKRGEPFRGNCKEQANKLINDAMKKRTLDKAKKKP